jgi:hypothetical protein
MNGPRFSNLPNEKDELTDKISIGSSAIFKKTPLSVSPLRGVSFSRWKTFILLSVCSQKFGQKMGWTLYFLKKKTVLGSRLVGGKNIGNGGRT